MEKQKKAVTRKTGRDAKTGRFKSMGGEMMPPTKPKKGKK